MKSIYLLLLAPLLGATAYGQVPTDNLVLHLPLSYGAYDYSGYGNNGVVDGAVITTDRFAIPYEAYSFDGVDDAIIVADDPVLDVSFPFTVSLWYYKDVYPVGPFPETLFKSDENTVNSGFWLSMNPAGQLAAGYGNGMGTGGGTRVSRTTTSSMTLGEWHQVTVIFRGLNDIDIYVDCELESATYSGSATSMVYLGGPTVLGRFDVIRYFDGELDNVRLYDDEITTEELPYFCYEAPCTQTVIVYDTITYVDTVKFYKSAMENTEVTNTGMKMETSIYPNPTAQYLTVDLGSTFEDLEGGRIELLSATGEIIYSEYLNQKLLKVDVAALGISDGTYFINLINVQGNVSESQKIVFKQ